MMPGHNSEGTTQMAQGNKQSKPAPLCVLPRKVKDGGTSPWLSSNLTTALRNKYGVNLEAAQRGADYLVESGMVQIPSGMSLKAVMIRRFGAVGFVLDDGQGPARTPKVAIEGLPD
jgi:hypothetical protein